MYGITRKQASRLERLLTLQAMQLQQLLVATEAVNMMLAARDYSAADFKTFADARKKFVTAWKKVVIDRLRELRQEAHEEDKSIKSEETAAVADAARFEQDQAKDAADDEKWFELLSKYNVPE